MFLQDDMHENTTGTTKTPDTFLSSVCLENFFRKGGWFVLAQVSLVIEVRRSYPRLEWKLSVGVILLLDAGVILAARISLKSRDQVRSSNVEGWAMALAHALKCM